MNERMQRIISALNGKGLKVEKQKDYIKAQCPSHKDDNPSLVFKQQSDGKITLTCHAGCEGSQVLSDLGLNFEVLYADEKKPITKKKKSGFNIDKVYPYTDESGVTLYETVRLIPKDFRQRRKLPSGKYVWSLKDVKRLVVYRLPEVLEARKEQKPVYLVEGEKDADALAFMGLTATTLPMGAGKKWHESYTNSFTGVHLVIIPDNDLPGKKHAVEVFKAIRKEAASIRILLLDSLADKEDVSDWLLKSGNDKKRLQKLAETATPLHSLSEVEELLGLQPEEESIEDSVELADRILFAETEDRIYSGRDRRVVADFAIDIRSIVYDDTEGRIFYIQVREREMGFTVRTNAIEVKPENLDDLRSFYKCIRPHTMGEIIQYKDLKIRPLHLFKWLLKKFDKPIVRRPDHVGFIQSQFYDKRNFWLFGNALICPAQGKYKAELILPNESDEYIVDEKTGFTLPLYQSPKEKEQLTPYININQENVEQFVGEIKSNLIRLIGGGDPQKQAGNYAKFLLGYVVYYLHEHVLYNTNDINGHGVMLYIHGPKGTGKTTYFNTILRAFFGLHKTKELKGNSVTTPAIENMLGHFSQLPVCYDEYNPEESKVDYQSINSYYHRSSRTVSDMDRKGRNKFTPIRTGLCITTNFRINLEVDQADATESRAVYFEYRKEYRSDDAELFTWFQDNLDELSRLTTHILMQQTDESRTNIRNEVQQLYQLFKQEVDDTIAKNPKDYRVEHRLTDNYSRLVACYEHIFGYDAALRTFTKNHILQRMKDALAQDNILISQIIFMASSGRFLECWQYHYSNSQKSLYVNIKQLYETYQDYKRNQAMPMAQFREMLLKYFEDECGGYEVETRKWYGTYYLHDRKIQINKPVHSYIFSYEQVAGNNHLKEMFPYGDSHSPFIDNMMEPETQRLDNNINNKYEEYPFDDDIPVF
ncbi:MAG: hypothetical protein LAT67_04985 [Balneolales bacterium]|nr:hypothetical protein [Balneolales bacterium]